MKKKKTEVDKVNEREQNLDRQTDRVVFFDWLRIIATFAVVVIHCCSKESLEVASYEWNTVHFYNCLSQWAVPAFVMISGALFLGREITLSKLFKKSIFRIGTAFLFWSVLYACWRFFVTHEKNSIREMVLSIIKGHYHMWFLFLIVGLYLVVPLLNKIVENQKLAVYFVVLAFLFAFLFPQIINVIGLKFEGPASILNEFISKFRVEMVLGYAGYFVLGYLLAQVRINKRAEALIYVLGVGGLAVTFFAGTWTAKHQGSTELFSDELTVNILMMTVAVFVFAKQHMNKPLKSEKATCVLSYISKCTFGVYLVHPLIIDCLKRFVGITNLLFNPIFSVPILALIVFICSMGISAILNKIPFVKKWFV